MFWAVLIGWIIVSFWLHVTLHEGAHWLTARWLGVKATITPWPHKLPNGRFVFGYTSLERNITGNLHVGLFSASPLIVELVWWLAALAIAYYGNVGGLILPIVLVELVSPVIDIAVYVFGFCSCREDTDADKLGAALGLTAEEGYSFVMIPLLMLIVSIVMVAALL